MAYHQFVPLEKTTLPTRNVYTVNPGWRLVLMQLGLKPADVLRRASLPADLFSREKATLTTAEYFRLWQGIEDDTKDPLTPLRIGANIPVEAFDPPIFAALCSTDLNQALQRIAHYKRLVCPMHLRVDITRRHTRLELEWLDATINPPAALVAAELVFFVQLVRTATRTPILPVAVVAPHPPEPADAYREFFGVPVRRGKRAAVSFRPDDAALPFLTANEGMWKFFEPELRRRLSEIERTGTVAERVHGALLELLPGGRASVDAVGHELGTTARTLQRKLQEEGRHFQSILNETREHLARHYLKTSTISGAEISFLLGFEDPNSFFRAFHAWTGETPEQVRVALQQHS